MISRDEGETYEGFLLLDERIYSAFPDVVEGNNGYIYVIYEHERGTVYRTSNENCAKEILMSKITEEDILNGRIINPGSRLNIIISRLGK